MEETRIVFDSGEEIATDRTTLHINCSASAIRQRTLRPIFVGRVINLQLIQLLEINSRKLP